MPGRYQKSKKRNWWLITLLSVLAAVDVLLLVWLFIVRHMPTEMPLPETAVASIVETTLPPATEQTQPPTMTQIQQPAEEPVKETVEPITEPVTEPQQPEFLTQMLESSGVDYEELEQIGCSQLIGVIAEGTTAQICFFSCQEGVWEEVPELFCQGCVGWNGVGADKQEGDGCTPSGLFGIGSAFYITDQPDTGLDVFQITNETYWVDDSDSVFYNQRVEGTQDKDWNSAEHMISYDVYRYGFVVEYNLQAVKNAGSAIFFHVGGRPTAGCVATEESMVLAYLKELDKEREPHILILSDNEA